MKKNSILSLILFLCLSLTPKEKFEQFKSLNSIFQDTTSILEQNKLIVSGYSQTEHLILGNPSHAIQNLNASENYLIIKHQYAESYNNSTGSPNWVCWHLDPSWKGNAKRCNCFSVDDELPNLFNKINSDEYSNSGFDRGHLCPSEDRDFNEEDNAATFLMSNMIPQSPNLNRVTWLAVENYCRKLIDNGNELYIIAGGYGHGGIGSKGYAEKIGLHHINVPARCWKIILALPVGNEDLNRIHSNTTVLALDMPNIPSVKQKKWTNYLTSVDAIEEKTGYDFFNFVDKNIQNILESRISNLSIEL